MTPNETITKRLWSITEPVCTSAGYELVDVVLTQSQTGWVLRVFIDHLPNSDDDAAARSNGPSATSGVAISEIGFDDCERVSRELSAVLDVEDPIEYAYNLEVSSPGLDRPLRTPAHFLRHLGQVAKVSLRHGINGRRNFKGTLLAFDSGEPPTGDSSDSSSKDPRDIPDTALGRATLTMDVDGTEYRLPFSDIETARLVPDWNSLFQRSQRR